MEVKKGDKTLRIPGWVIAAGIVTIGAIVTDICKTVDRTRKQYQSKGLWLKIAKALSFIFLKGE